MTIGLGIIFVILVFVIGPADPPEYRPDSEIVEQQIEFDFEERLTIMSFNIQIFGKSKAAKPEVMDILADIIMQYDMVAIQEVRDASGTAVPMLMEMLTPDYDYFLGPREGRSNSKEQYLFIWDSRKFDMIGNYVFNDSEDWFERDPLAAHFQTYDGGMDFVIINNHISPKTAEEEIPYLIAVADEVEMHFKESDLIILGDFNADGGYFPEEELIDVFGLDRWQSLIGNSVNTTVAKSDNTYDRIIVSNYFLQDITGETGVYYFEDYYDFSHLTIEPKNVSDHYPVWIEIYNDKDTD